MEGPLVKIIETQTHQISGKLEFVSHLLKKTLEKTNIQLDSDNMQYDFKYYKDNRERYPDEFKYAFTIFEENLRELQEKTISKILNDLFGGD